MEYDVVTKSEANVLRKAVQEQSGQSDKAWLNHCFLIHQVFYSGIGDELKALYEVWGFETWHDYVELELGLHVGTANTMVRVAHFFGVKMDGVWKKDQILSRQRMRALATAGGKVTKENLQQWITKALSLTVCQLEAELHDRAVIRKTVSVNLTPADAKILNKAIDALMENGDFATRGDALMSVFKPRAKSKAA